jgi:hypothetical protein
MLRTARLRGDEAHARIRLQPRQHARGIGYRHCDQGDAMRRRSLQHAGTRCIDQRCELCGIDAIGDGDPQQHRVGRNLRQRRRRGQGVESPGALTGHEQAEADRDREHRGRGQGERHEPGRPRARRRVQLCGQAAQVHRHVRREDRFVGNHGVQRAQFTRLAVGFEVAGEQCAHRFAFLRIKGGVFMPRQQFEDVVATGACHVSLQSIG